MIELLVFNKFKSLTNVQLRLGNFNCLIGRNGAGKGPAKGFNGEQAAKKKFQNKSKVIKAKNAEKKKKNLAKILTKA